MIGDGLAYLSVAVRDVDAVASTLETHFRLRRTECTVGPTGRRAPVLRPPTVEHPSVWALYLQGRVR